VGDAARSHLQEPGQGRGRAAVKDDLDVLDQQVIDIAVFACHNASTRYVKSALQLTENHSNIHF